MGKSLILLVMLVIFSIQGTSLPWPLPLEGNVNIKTDIIELTAHLINGSAQITGNLINSLSEINGRSVIRITNVSNMENGTAEIESMYTISGKTRIIWENSTITLTNFTATSYSEASQCLPNDNNILCTHSYKIVQGNNSYNMHISVNLFPIVEFNKDEVLNLTFEEANIKGNIALNFSNVLSTLEVNFPIKEYFNGTIKFSNNSLSRAQLRLETKELKGNHEIINGVFGINDSVWITGFVGTEVKIFADNVLLTTLILKENNRKNEFNFIYPEKFPADFGFSDSDRDGTPDSSDHCSNSPSVEVDISGCSCSQRCYNQSCKLEIGKLEFSCYQEFLPCFDGIKNNDEKGIDCGGICGDCMDNSSFFSPVSQVSCVDCRQCKCQEGFTCNEDGSCKLNVPLQGKKCKTNDFFYDLNQIDCGSKGETWIKENKDNFISLNVDGFPIIDHFVKKQAKKRFEKVTLCINTEDIGCVSSTATCSGERQLTPENKMKAANMLRQEIQKEIKMPSLLSFFVDVGVNVNLNGFSLEIPYQCQNLTLNSNEACNSLIQNGPSLNKADVLFIGDGFLGDQELAQTVLELIDYNQSHQNTTKEGLFSEEPFKSNKEKFNVWYTNSNGKIHYELDDFFPSSGLMPSLKDIHQISTKCPWHDYIVVLSKNQNYRANCLLGKPGPCRISLVGQDYPGKLLTHEFGHGFAALVDEYYNYVERKDNPNSLERYFSEFLVGPNCKQTSLQAQAAWGDLAEGEEVSFFEGCGGDCGKECGTHIRPTFTSIMKYQNEHCEKGINGSLGGYSCQLGPPFNDFFKVNQKEIVKELEQYS